MGIREKRNQPVKKDIGWLFLNSESMEPYAGADGSWGTKNVDGSAWYTGTDGSSGYRNTDGSITYFGKRDTSGYRNADGSGIYYGPGGRTQVFKAGDGPDTEEELPAAEKSGGMKGAWSAYLAAMSEEGDESESRMSGRGTADKGKKPKRGGLMKRKS